MSAPDQITVVGAGLMEHGIAQICARRGHPAWLLAAHEETVSSTNDRVRANLTNMGQQGVALGAGVDEILAQIHTTDGLPLRCAQGLLDVPAEQSGAPNQRLGR